MTKKNHQGLGKSLLRSRFKNQQQMRMGRTIVHPVIESDSGTLNKSSITEQNDLDTFLSNAELADTDFTAEKQNVQVIAGSSLDAYILSPERERQLLEEHKKVADQMTIPRRPTWSTSMTPEELNQLEKQHFLEWRRKLALLEENYIMTPFEKNIEMWRQLWRVVERSHLLVQIVDARNPLLFRSDDVDKYVKEINPEKRNLLLINKADYLDENQRKAWAEYLEKKNISFVFYSAKISGEVEEDEEESKNSSSVVGKKELIRILLSFQQFFDVSTLVVGLIGFPNVGKSSTINSLMGEKKVAVAATPGKTKHFQTIHLMSNLVLCDCPGLVFPSFATTKAELVVNGILPIDQLRECMAPSSLVCQRIPRALLEATYGINIPLPLEHEDPSRPPTAAEVLATYAIARGFRRSVQGNPDESRAARFILKDYVNGKLLYCQPPPGIDGFIFNQNQFQENLDLIFASKQTNAQTAAAVKSISEKPTLTRRSEFDLDFFHQNFVQMKVKGRNPIAEFNRIKTGKIGVAGK